MKKFFMFFLLINISYSCSGKDNVEIIKIGHIGEFDYVINKPVYKLYNLAMELKKKLR